MSLDGKRCLILSSSWFPIGIESLEDSLTKLSNQGKSKNKILVIDRVFYDNCPSFDRYTFDQWVARGYSKTDNVIRTGRITFKTPEVIMKPCTRPFIQKTPLKAANVFARDGHKCWYCGSDFVLTLDHIIPSSRGGKSSWKNLITCCKKCNNEKGDMEVSKFCKMKGCEIPSPVNAGSYPWLKQLGKSFPESWSHYVTGLQISV